MGGEVILVALDASKDTNNDYALEWTVQNMAKDGDSLILLVFLPSLGHTKPNSNRRLQSLACYYLSCFMKHNKGSPFDQVGQSKTDISRHVNNVYVLKMQQLWLDNNLMQVRYKVKVILDMQPGAVATEAKEHKASWVILDRLLKKEADYCAKQLNSNIVFMDQAVPRILKAVSPFEEINPSEAFNPLSHEFLHLNSENFSKDFKYLKTFNPSSQIIIEKAMSFSISNPPTCFEESDITLDSDYGTSLDYESYLRGSLAKSTQNFN